MEFLLLPAFWVTTKCQPIWSGSVQIATEHPLSRSTWDHVLVNLCCLHSILRTQNALIRLPMAHLPRCTKLHFSGVLLSPQIFPTTSYLLCLKPQFFLLSLITGGWNFSSVTVKFQITLVPSRYSVFVSKSCSPSEFFQDT